MRQQIHRNIRNIVLYTLTIALLSLAYFVYMYILLTIPEERETLLTEIGENFGNIGLLLLIFIYFRTVLKLLLGQGKLAQRLLPDYTPLIGASFVNRLLTWMNRTHVYFGMAAVAIIVLHIVMMDFSRYQQILFFPIVLTLVIWQGIFGLFLTVRYTPGEFKKFSYLVHAQFVSGIALGIFALFGHFLIDD